MEEKKIHLAILGQKNLSTLQLSKILDELEVLDGRLLYTSLLYEPIQKLRNKVKGELRRREVSKYVWVEFIGEWSGYRSTQRKPVAQFYRKVPREKALSMPRYYSHPFTDGTTNDWRISIVDVPGKSGGSYSSQVDDFLKTL